MSRAQWRPRTGKCVVCGRRGPIWFHHIVTRNHVEREGGDVWDFRNALPVGRPVLCSCHADHHSAKQRIPIYLIPECAHDFAVELLGEDRAAAYWRRYYHTTYGGRHAA